MNWKFALFRERVHPVFGNRSCFSGKGINYSKKARLLTLCPGTALGRRGKNSCLQRLPGSARFCQSPNCCSLNWGGLGNQVASYFIFCGIVLFKLQLSYQNPPQETNHPNLRLYLIYKHPPHKNSLYIAKVPKLVLLTVIL